MGLTITEFPQRIVDNNPALISKWSAINHSMLFKMERQDYPVQLFYNSGTEVMTAIITFGTMIDSPLPGDEIYIESSSASGTFIIDSFSFPNIFIFEPQTISNPFGSSGFINLLSRKNYFIRTNVWGVNEKQSIRINWPK